MRLVKAAAILILFAAIGVAEAAAEPYHLRIGWVIPGGDLVTLMFAKPGLATHAGESYVPDLLHFQGTASAMQALVIGDLDCVALAYSTFALGIVHAGMTDLRAIGDEFQDGVPGYHTNTFVVRDDSPIRTVEDLKGKVVASNERGSAADMAVRAMLAKNHLEDGRDLTIIEARFADQKALLKDKKVDLITAVSPFGFDPELRSFSRTLFRQVDAIGRSQMTVRVARQGFIAEHRAVMVDFMEDYLRTLRFVQDPSHRDETIALLTQVTKRDPSFYQGWVFTNRDYFRDPRALPNLEALQANIDLQKTLGFLRAQVEVDKYADLSLVKEAAERLDKKPGR